MEIIDLITPLTLPLVTHNDDNYIVEQNQQVAEESSSNQSLNNEAGFEIVSTRGNCPNIDFPHLRYNCGNHSYLVCPAKYCDNCFCYVCDKPVYECSMWDEHCHANPNDTAWEEKRKQVKASYRGYTSSCCVSSVSS